MWVSGKNWGENWDFIKNCRGSYNKTSAWILRNLVSEKKEVEISKRRCKDSHSREGFLNDQLSSILAKGCFISPDWLVYQTWCQTTVIYIAALNQEFAGFCSLGFFYKLCTEITTAPLQCQNASLESTWLLVYLPKLQNVLLHVVKLVVHKSYFILQYGHFDGQTSKGKYAVQTQR